MTPGDVAALLNEADDIIAARTSARPRVDHLRALKQSGESMSSKKTKTTAMGLVLQPGIVIPAAALEANQVAEYAACSAILRVISDGWNDYQAYVQGPKNAFAAFAYFGNLAPDAVNVVVNLQALPKELGELDSATLDHLLSEFAANISLTTDRARDILAAVLKLASDVRDNVADILDLISAIKTSQPA